MDSALAARPTVDSLTRANYMGAVANRVDSFWVPDHLNALFPRSIWAPKYSGAPRLTPRADASMEPWTMLGHLAARNRLARLRLGVSVTDTGRRNPAVIAQAAATLHLLTRGRAILGIGTGEREGNEPYGVDWSKPVARFEEALATIRALWNSGGELVNRESPFFPLRNAVFDLPPYRGIGPRSGSLPMARACCVLSGATRMPGSRRSRTVLKTTRNAWNSFVPRPPTPGAIRCRSCQPWSSWSSRVLAAMPSTRRLILKS